MEGNKRLTQERCDFFKMFISLNVWYVKIELLIRLGQVENDQGAKWFLKNSKIWALGKASGRSPAIGAGGSASKPPKPP